MTETQEELAQRLEEEKRVSASFAPFSRQDEKFRMAISSGIDDLLRFAHKSRDDRNATFPIKYTAIHRTSYSLLFKKQDAMGRAWTPCLGFKLLDSQFRAWDLIEKYHGSHAIVYNQKLADERKFHLSRQVFSTIKERQKKAQENP